MEAYAAAEPAEPSRKTRAASRNPRAASRNPRAARPSRKTHAAAEPSRKTRAASRNPRAAEPSHKSRAASKPSKKTRAASKPSRKTRAASRALNKPRAGAKSTCDEDPGPVPFFPGERVEVFWPNEDRWFTGTVKEVDENDNTYKVYYFIDGQEAWHPADMKARSVQEEVDDMQLLLGTPPEGWSGED